MDDQLHIIIAGETGGSRSIPFTRKKLYITLFSSAFILAGLVIGCTFATKNTADNLLLKRKIARLEGNIEEISRERQDLQAQIVSINETNTRHLNDLRVQHDLETTTLKLENATLISNAVSELNERSELIESVMSNVGVEIQKNENDSGNDNSGGLYIPSKDDSYDQLLEKADSYLETIKTIPVGRPVPGPITSRYGKRVDPLNGKRGFHTGVDFRGRKGDRIYATADGTVTKAFNNGGFGRYVEIDHGNGYKTRFAHMQNYVVKKGEKVQRGQLIGQVGNTGRSTGPHLHYEVILANKTVNPAKFIKIADISHSFNSGAE